MAPTLDRGDAAQKRRSGGRRPGRRQATHHQMHHGQHAAGQRGHRQQLDDARQWKANRKGDQQFEVAAAKNSSLIDDEEQQEQDGRGDQRFGDMRRTGKLACDPKQRQRQAKFVMDQSCRDVGHRDIEQQRYFKRVRRGSNPVHRLPAAVREGARRAPGTITARTFRELW